MEFVIVVLLCMSNTCGWHKLPAVYPSFADCVEHGKVMDFDGVARAGCAKAEDASDLPEFNKDK